MMRFIAALLVGIAAAAGTASAADYSIKLAHSLSSTEPAHLAAEFFAKNVAERSGGRIDVQVFPGEQLGSGKDVNAMIRGGANVMNITDPGYLSDFVPDIGVLNGPYLLRNADEFRKILASDWLKEIDAQAAEGGLPGRLLQQPVRPPAHDRRQADPHAGRHPGCHGPRAAEPDVARDLQGDGRAAHHRAVVGGLQRPAAGRGGRGRGALWARSTARSCSR